MEIDINSLFIPYNYAVELKKLGFKEKCLGSFYTKIPENIVSSGVDWGGKFNGLEFHEADNDYQPNFILNTDKNHYVSAPLYQQAFDFMLKKLSEKYKLDYRISLYGDNSGYISLHNIYTCYFENDGWVDVNFKTKTECLEQLLRIYE